MLKSIKSVFRPSKAVLRKQQDLQRANMLLQGYEHCKQANIKVPTPADMERFSREQSTYSKRYLETKVEYQIRQQLVDMFEAVDKESEFPYVLTTGQSSIPSAGQGLFLVSDEDIIPGTVVALYPGRVYLKFELMKEEILQSLFPDEHHYLMSRSDDTIIDPRGMEGIPFNPFAFGHYINHCGASRKPNVYQIPYDYADDFLGRQKISFPQHLRKYIPNIYANEPDFFTKMSLAGRCMKGVVFLAIRPISNGEEILMDYRFAKSPALAWPDWYEPTAESERGNY